MQTPTLTASSPTRRAIIFARARTIPDDLIADRPLVDAQLDHCREVAAGLGAAITHEYVAIGGTTDPAVRDLIQAMLEAVATDRTDYLITDDVSRLTRSIEEMQRIEAQLAETGTCLVTSIGTEPTVLFAGWPTSGPRPTSRERGAQ